MAENISDTAKRLEKALQTIEDFDTTALENANGILGAMAEKGAAFVAAQKEVQQIEQEINKIIAANNGERTAEVKSVEKDLKIAKQKAAMSNREYRNLVKINKAERTGFLNSAKAFKAKREEIKVQKGLATAAGDAGKDYLKAVKEEEASMYGGVGRRTGVMTHGAFSTLGSDTGEQDLYKGLETAGAELAGLAGTLGPWGVLIGAGVSAMTGLMVSTGKSFDARMEGVSRVMATNSNKSAKDIYKAGAYYMTNVNTAADKFVISGQDVLAAGEVAMELGQDAATFLNTATIKGAITMQQVNTYMKGFGISAVDATKMLTSSVQSTSKVYGAEQARGKILNSMNRILGDSRMAMRAVGVSSRSYANQLTQAVDSTKNIGVDAEDLSEWMVSLSQRGDRIGPSADQLGAKAAEMATSMRNIPKAARVLMSGGLGGIVDWKNKSDAERRQAMKEGPLGSMLFANKNDSTGTAVSGMLWEMLGFSEDNAILAANSKDTAVRSLELQTQLMSTTKELAAKIPDKEDIARIGKDINTIKSSIIAHWMGGGDK